MAKRKEITLVEVIYDEDSKEEMADNQGIRNKHNIERAQILIRWRQWVRKDMPTKAETKESIVEEISKEV